MCNEGFWNIIVLCKHADLVKHGKSEDFVLQARIQCNDYQNTLTRTPKEVTRPQPVTIPRIVAWGCCFCPESREGFRFILIPFVVFLLSLARSIQRKRIQNKLVDTMRHQMRHSIPLLSAIFDDQDVYLRKSNETFLTPAGALNTKEL